MTIDDLIFPVNVATAALLKVNDLGRENFVKQTGSDVVAYLNDVYNHGAGLRQWSGTIDEWVNALETNGFHTERRDMPEMPETCDRADADARLLHAALALPLVVAKVIVARRMCLENDECERARGIFDAVNWGWVNATEAVLHKKLFVNVDHTVQCVLIGLEQALMELRSESDQRLLVCELRAEEGWTTN